MDDIFQRAARAGVETAYWDAFGELRNADPEVLSRLLGVLSDDKTPPNSILPRPVVIRGDAVVEIRLSAEEGLPFAWEILSDQKIADGHAISPSMTLHGRLPCGIFRLRVTLAASSDHP